MRSAVKFIIENPLHFSTQLLNWSNQFKALCYLNSNIESQTPNQKNQQINYDILLGADAVAEICVNSGAAFTTLKHFYETKKDWLFGYLSYDLKNETEVLSSKMLTVLIFLSFIFFKPAMFLA